MQRWLIVTFAATISNTAALGETFHVDASAPPASDRHRRISDAVARAGQDDIILVAPGVYATEDVPIVVGPEKRGLTIAGSTVLVRDARDLPTDIVQATAAIVTAGRSGPERMRPLIYVTADEVTITGLVIDGQTWMTGILVDGNLAPGGAIGRFTIADNWFHFCDTCLFTRGASGTIEGNLIGKVSDAHGPLNSYTGFGGHHGANVAGGRVPDATFVEVRKNRVAGNRFGVYAIGDRATAFPPEEGLEAHEPGALKLLVADNDFTRNGGAGLLLLAHGNRSSSDPHEPSLVVAEVRGNTFSRNFHHGLVIHAPMGAFAPSLCADAAAGEVHATLAQNVWDGNEANDALFSFTAFVRSVYGEPACFVHDHRTIVEGDVPSFDRDAPGCDPDASGCVPLRNTLLVNDLEVTGTSVTPRK